MLDLRLLRFFIAIYEEKNITAAAARCHVSQPSLSAGLRQLEESLGDSLFIRGKKGVEAKDPAHYLYPHAVKLVEEARRLPTLFRQKATRARLNMAIMPDLSRRRLAGLLRRVQGVLPELDLTLSDYGTPADCRLPTDPGCPAPGGRDLPAALGRGVRAVRSQGTPSCGQGAYRAG